MIENICQKVLYAVRYTTCMILLIFTGLFSQAQAQSQSQAAYFTDGYHGGIYGHYPYWVTRFIIDELTKHPEWRIHLEIEPETWDSVKINDPQTYQEFKRFVNDPRIEFANPSYAQPYLYNNSGESIIRQFEYGIRKIREHFPEAKFTVYSAEEPCFTSCLPQILKLFGFKYAVLKNPDTCWGGYTSAFGGELVDWTGPDGTCMLTVPRYACEAFENKSTWQTKAWNNSKEYLDACRQYGIKHPVGMCYQDAGWRNGPWLGFGDSIKNQSQYTTWYDYIENIADHTKADHWRFSQEDVLVGLMWGSQVMQRIAQQVRQSENTIIMAEKIRSMANIKNHLPYPNVELDSAWRTLMLAQHHDSWIVPYNRLRGRTTWANAIRQWTNHTDSLSSRLINEAARSWNKTGETKNLILGYVQVFNTSGYARTENVKVELPNEIKNRFTNLYDDKNKPITSFKNGSFLTFKAETPALGYSVYRIEEEERRYFRNPSGITFNDAGDCVIENEYYRLIFDLSKGGCIKSFICKAADNKELIDPKNKFAFGEIRGYFYEDERFYSSIERPVRFSIVNNEDLEKSIKIEGYIDKHPFTQVVTLTSGLKTIDFSLKIHWQGNPGIGEYKQGDNWRDNRRAFYDDSYKLSILFPTGLSSPVLYKNAPFDVCESRLDNTFFNTWDSIKHNIILHWVDLFAKKDDFGIALFSDHTTSYSFGEDYPLGLTAQYAGKGLWGMNYAITQDLEMHYAILPHHSKWNEAHVSEANNHWNEPLTALFCRNISQDNTSFITMKQRGYEITSLRADDKAIILRLYNAEENDTPLPVQFHFPVKKIEEVQLNGQLVSEIPISFSAGQSAITLQIPPYGIRTYRLYR